jgi:EAL domain-containing protein (putative c-di-GMP-specific phosphodiesterase class I)
MIDHQLSQPTEETNHPQLREFTVDYNPEGLIHKAKVYGLNLSYDSHISIVVDLDKLAHINNQLMGHEKNESLDQLFVLMTSWPSNLKFEDFTKLINACIETWISAVNQGTEISTLLGITHCIHLTGAIHNEQHAFTQFLSDLVCETLYQHQTYQIHYLLEHDSATDLPNNNVLNRVLVELSENQHAFSLLSIRIIVERGTTTVSPVIPSELSNIAADILNTNIPKPFHIFQSGHLLFNVIIEKSLNEFQFNLLIAKIKGGFESIISINGHSYLVTPAVGAVLEGANSQPHNLLHHAKLALNHAVATQQDFVIYTQSLTENEEKQRQLELEIIAAFNNEDLDLYLQPILSLPEEVCVGAEVLLRWPNSRTKGIYPNVVVEVINKVGLGKMFTRWLVHSVCRLASELIHNHKLDVYLTLNIRAEDLYDIELPYLVKQSAEFWKIQPKDIILEITENGILEENETTTNTIKHITENGFKLALDDFGTGYSSMARLRNLPISLIKIDQSFVKNIDRSDEDMKIVESMTLLGQSLGKEVLVEGLETLEGLKLINQIGIKKAQGFFFSRPMPFNEFVTWAKNKGAN